VSTQTGFFVERFPSRSAKIIKRVDLEINISSPRRLMVEQVLQQSLDQSGLCFHPVFHVKKNIPEVGIKTDV